MRCTVRNGWKDAAKCRQKQYHRVRTAARFVAKTLSNTTFMLSSSSKTNLQREQLARSLVGVPPSLAHEGPLGCRHLSAFAAVQQNELFSILESTMTNELVTSTSSHVKEMWPAVLQERYVREATRVHVVESKGTHPARFEAGLATHRVLSAPADETRICYPSTAGDAISGGGKEHKGSCCVSLVDDLHSKESQAKARRWRQLIDDYTLFLPDRSPQHELENLPQEIGIGELLFSLLESQNQLQMGFQTVVDVGGGNGFLAAQMGERFRCESLVIDPFTPKHAIDNDEFPHWVDSPRCRSRVTRRYPLRRIARLLPDVDWRSMSLQFDRCALIAKHLCGTVIDESLQHLHSLDKLPQVIVVVPCCFNKGHYRNYCNPEYLKRVAGVQDETAWGELTKLTDWNCSCHQQTGARVSAVTQGDSQTASCPGGRRPTMGDIVPCMDDVANLVEAVINYGRVLWLRQKGYHAFTVRYVPRCITPKNSAIVAVRNVPSIRPAPPATWG